MNILALDLGGTKISAAIFDLHGKILWEKYVLLNGRSGNEVAELMINFIQDAKLFLEITKEKLSALGVAVPGVSFKDRGTVYAPNIPGWDDFPLMQQLQNAAPDIIIEIESDRSCYIMGEYWKGSAKNSENAIFVAVGTGIGAGIIANGKLIRGHGDIAGAIGWMALNKGFEDRYKYCGCFETYASGGGLQKEIVKYVDSCPDYSGYFKSKEANLNTTNLINQYKLKDEVATAVLNDAVAYWGMGIANLISIFNPEKVILGGGVFGEAKYFLDEIKVEAAKWAQPISMKQVEVIVSTTGSKTGLLGAAYLAHQKK